MDQNELNEVGTLLHIVESVATNHPTFPGIGRACQRRLNEIEGELRKAEQAEAQQIKQAEANRQAQNYEQPRDGSEKVVTPADGPANSAIQRKPGGPIEKLSTDKRSQGEKLLDQPADELPPRNDEAVVERRV